MCSFIVFMPLVLIYNLENKINWHCCNTSYDINTSRGATKANQTKKTTHTYTEKIQLLAVIAKYINKANAMLDPNSFLCVDEACLF